MSVLMRIVPISQLFSSNRDSTEFLSQAAGMFKAYEDPGWDDDLTIGHRCTHHMDLLQDFEKILILNQKSKYTNFIRMEAQETF